MKKTLFDTGKIFFNRWNVVFHVYESSDGKWTRDGNSLPFFKMWIENHIIERGSLKVYHAVFAKYAFILAVEDFRKNKIHKRN